jgi:hypothetical protein
MVLVLSIEESGMGEKTLAHSAFSVETLHFVAEQWGDGFRPVRSVVIFVDGAPWS